ncbi:hypothetical protein ABK040_004602 [Willaertia magna]
MSQQQRFPINKTFFTGKYPIDHWAIQPCKLNDPKIICLATYKKENHFAIYLNPIDKRGYRSIVRLINNENMESIINRDYNLNEKIGLQLMMQIMSQIYTNIGIPISQQSILGNNSHRFENGITYLGKEEEPSFLHGHVYGRGDPNYCYIENVKLDGPVPGLMFDLLANNDSKVKGNEEKVSWKEGEMEKVAFYFKKEMNEIKNDFIELGIEIEL